MKGERERHRESSLCRGFDRIKEELGGEAQGKHEFKKFVHVSIGDNGRVRRGTPKVIDILIFKKRSPECLRKKKQGEGRTSGENLESSIGVWGWL